MDVILIFGVNCQVSKTLQGRKLYKSTFSDTKMYKLSLKILLGNKIF